MAAEGNLVPSQWDYLGEELVRDDRDDVRMPCNFFSDRYWRFCFHYVSISVAGTTRIE